MSADREIEEVTEAAALFAIGSLAGEEAQRFEARIRSGCPLCMAELNRCQRSVEDLLLASPAVAPAPGVEARLMERIGRLPSVAGSNIPEIIRSAEGRWLNHSAGVQLKLLKGKRTLLVRMAAGATYPTHVHQFDEQCLVLEGTIEDREGTSASAGDFVFMAKGSTHPEIFTRTGALFLIAYT